MEKVAHIADSHDVHEGALHRMFDEAYAAVGNDRAHATTAAHMTAEFVKTGTLLVPSLWGKAACAAVYASDEVKHSDLKTMVKEIGMGAVKGAALHSILHAAFLQRMTPVAQGVINSLGSRLTDKATTPTTYEHPMTHKFDGTRALATMIKEISDVPTLVRDVVTYKFANSVMPRAKAEHVEEVAEDATTRSALINFAKLGSPVGDACKMAQAEDISRIKSLTSMVVASAVESITDGSHGKETEQQRDARIAAIEMLERFIMGKSQGFQDGGKSAGFKQLLDFVRRAKYVNSMPASKAG